MSGSQIKEAILSPPKMDGDQLVRKTHVHAQVDAFNSYRSFMIKLIERQRSNAITISRHKKGGSA